jgi:cytochrome c553
VLPFPLHRVLQSYQTRERRHDEMNHATGFLNEEALLAVAAYYATLVLFSGKQTGLPVSSAKKEERAQGPFPANARASSLTV